MPFVDLLAQQGAQAAGNIVGAGMGLALQGINNKQQLKQQQKLTDMQIAAQKQMGIFNRQQQMQLWNDTNYAAQKEQMKKAGLSPGLMYGTSGGGATTASATPGNVSAPTARQSNESLGMGLQMGQAAMMQAQIQLTKAQTEKTLAETQAVAPGIEKTKTETASIAQGINNQKAVEELTKTQQGIAAIQEHIAGKTQNAQIGLVMEQLKQIDTTNDILKNDRTISDNTVQTKIQLLKWELTNSILESYLTKAQTSATTQSEKESITRVQMMVQKNMREWDALSNDSQRRIQSVAEYEEAQGGLPKDVKDLLDNIIIIPGLGGKTGPTPVTGFHKRN